MAVGLVVLDLDGVVWLGEAPLDGAADAVAALRAGGADVLFLTNNSSRTVDHYVHALGRAGIVAEPDDVVTSAVATGRRLATSLTPGARVLACAGDGVVDALGRGGMDVVSAWPCEAVVVGWHREFDFDRLARAADAVRRGARFVATNLDATYPAPEGLLPGSGAIVAAVAVAGGRPPDEVTGKPHPPTVGLVAERAGERPGVVIGDRASTDGALAEALGWPFALVHSDVSATEAGVGVTPALEGASLAEVTEDVVRVMRR